MMMMMVRDNICVILPICSKNCLEPRATPSFFVCFVLLLTVLVACGSSTAQDPTKATAVTMTDA